MKISAKGRYAIAAMIRIAGRSAENVSVLSIAGGLGISKVYLEQVFTQLKKAELLKSVKGARGGYQLSRPASKISVWEVLLAVETSLSETSDEVKTVGDGAPEIERALKDKVLNALDKAVRDSMSSVNIAELLDYSEHQSHEQFYMMGL
ncbi:Rrf2 family transcriptional regulator [Clostridia bacterium]|nr:Rrf2 family transcriptional regulator [Clostridia bacterium]